MQPEGTTRKPHAPERRRRQAAHVALVVVPIA
jgi:hypothetical protein